MIDLNELIDILACPDCKTKLELDSKASELLCENCGKRYPLTNGVPDFVTDTDDTENNSYPPD